jgi:DNA repair exonuclease SbcCD ATPase subunit
MKIELKSLNLQHFKGAKNLLVNFGFRTSVWGANASGKTRLFDAWSWLLFGKDSDDRKDFNIKSLDANNNPLHQVDHSVTGVLSVDGRNVVVQRIFKEKWVKKRGEETPEFAGHETLFFIDGIPYQMKDFQKYIENLLPESMFKQVTNPLYFNSMAWGDRRAVLFKMAGGVNDAEVAASNTEIRKFFDSLGGKDVELYRRELAAKKKLLKESIADLPVRIDEAKRGLLEEPNYQEVEKEIARLNARITEIDGLLQSEAERFNAANRKNVETQNRINELKRKITDLQFEDRQKAENEVRDLTITRNRLAAEIQTSKNDIKDLQVRIQANEKIKSDLESQNNTLRTQWDEENARILLFDENEFVCPACKRPLETSDIDTRKEELTRSFNESKVKKLDMISYRGKTNKEDIETRTRATQEMQDKITALEQTVAAKQQQHDALTVPEPKIIANPEIEKIQQEISQINESFQSVTAADNSELKIEKTIIGSTLTELSGKLQIKAINEQKNARIKELTDSEKTLAQQIASLEKAEYQCEMFTRAKIAMIEQRVNSMFSFVKFKMFNTLINGGVEETCETLLDGVPFADANNAKKIQGGLDIIRTISKHYDIYAPVFIDNRESVTDIPEMDCQVISLYVSPEDATLRITNEVSKEVAKNLSN